MTQSGEPSPPSGWYPDPAGTNDWRWYDGSQWSHYVCDGPPPKPLSERAYSDVFPAAPKNRPQWIAFAVSALVGLAIWIPDMAMHPLYSDGVKEDNGSGWFFVLTLVAAIVVAAVFSRTWQVVAPGLLIPQFLLAPWTTPRGDNDGLWAVIFFILGFLFVLAHILAGVSALVTEKARRRRRTTVES